MWFPSVLLRAQNLEPAAKSVLVKFNFTNPRLIPAGIPQKQRQDNKVVDVQHALMASSIAMPELGEIGRIRPGRVDTGKATIDNAQLVQVGVLRRGLANIGFALQDSHWFTNPTSGKHVVVMTYVPIRAVKDIRNIKLPASTIAALRELATTTWNYCHVWENPNGVVTINCAGRQPQTLPMRTLSIRKGALEMLDVRAMTTEEQEAETSTDAAFQLFKELGFNPHMSEVAQLASMIKVTKSSGQG